MHYRKWILGGLGLAALGGAMAYAQYRNIEQPNHQTVMADESFEVRDYPAMVVAEVTHEGDRREASSASFRRLAAYIFGNDRPQGGEEISMTAPVMQERVDQNEAIAMTAPVMQSVADGDSWRMRFVMPAKYRLDTLPTPPADITLTVVPARRVAAVRFNGEANADDLGEMERNLIEWMAERDLTKVGGIEYAFYDAPMVPGPLRRNEVMIEVAVD
jgi:DNA gyrase inhibitor GyrI